VLQDVLNGVKGDIVIPGLFVALLLRDDATRARVSTPLGLPCYSSFPQPHFAAQVLAYALGLIATVAVVFLFDHCLGCSLLVALLRGTGHCCLGTDAMLAYDEETAHSALKAAAQLEKKEAMEKKTE
jgi:hypothetical protein